MSIKKTNSRKIKECPRDIVTRKKWEEYQLDRMIYGKYEFYFAPKYILLGDGSAEKFHVPRKN